MMLIYMNILDDDDDIGDDDDDGISMLYMLHSFIFIDDTVSIRGVGSVKGMIPIVWNLCWQGRIWMMLDRSVGFPTGDVWYHMHNVSFIHMHDFSYNMINICYVTI